jgi:uncharacterized protein YjlB
MSVGTAVRNVSPVSLLLPGDGETPNNPRLEVMHYPQVFNATDASLASQFETLFAQHDWPPAWRNGIFGFHHFHSTAHEALGIYSGEVTVRLGGEGGADVVLRAGDVAVLPAGVGHKQLSCVGSLGVVGAYPAGQVADACRPDASRFDARMATICSLALPSADPVYGVDGPLMRRWHDAGSSK